MSETMLVRRAHLGDEAAWDTLVREHQQAIFRLAYLLLGDAGEAEDVAQETFIRALRALHTFDDTRPLRPWLLRIAANLSHNQRRSAGRYLQALSRLVRFSPEPVTSLGERSSQKEEAATLWQAVQRLNRSDQEVIYLRYFMDLSEAETAEALVVAPGTVKSRLSRALGRLRQVVDTHYPALREGRSE